MTKQPQHPENAKPRDESAATEHAEPSIPEKGSSWVKTSQDRAQEGVSPDAREQLPVSDSRPEASFGRESSVVGANAVQQPSVPTIQTYDPWAQVYRDVASQHLHEYEHRDDYHYQEEYHPYHYGTYDHVYEAPQQAAYPSFGYVPSYWPDYVDSRDYGWHHGRNREQGSSAAGFAAPASSFAEPAAAFVAEAHSAQTHVQPDESARTWASPHVVAAAPAFAPSAEAHLQPEYLPIQQHAEHPAVPAAIPSILSDAQGTLPSPELLQERHDRHEHAPQPVPRMTENRLPEVVSYPEHGYLPDRPSTACVAESSFVRDDVHAGSALLDRSDAYRQTAHSREEAASSIVSDDSPAALLGETAAAAGYGYARSHPGEPFVAYDDARRTPDPPLILSSEPSIIAGTPMPANYTAADIPALPANMAAEQLQALHSHLNGNGAPFESAAGEHRPEPHVREAPHASYDSGNRLTVNRVSADRFVMDRTIEDPHLGGSLATAHAMARGTEHIAASSLLSSSDIAAVYGALGPSEGEPAYAHPESGRAESWHPDSAGMSFGAKAHESALVADGSLDASCDHIENDILAAPSASLVRESVEAAEDLEWTKAGSFWTAEAGAAQMLVRDLGPEVTDGRFAWAVGSAKGGSHLKGFVETLDDAKASAVLQAALHGYAGENDLHEARESAGPSSFRSRSAAGERSGNLDGLLVDPAEKHGMAEGFLFAPETKPDGPESKDLLASGSSAETLLLGSDASEGPDVLGGSGSSGGSELKKAGAAAGKAVIGAAGIPTRVAAAAGKAAVGVADVLVDSSMREDDDLRHVADAKDVARESVSFADRRIPARKRESLEEKVLKAETVAQSALSNGSASASGEGRGKADAVDAKDLSSHLEGGKGGRSKGETTVSEKRAGAERHLLGEGDGEGPSDNDGVPKKAKKPVTEREREAARKKAEKHLAKKEGDRPEAMSVVKAGGRIGTKGALFAGGAAISSAKKVVASQDENLAVALTMADKTKKAVRTAKSVAKLPVRVYHTAKTLASIVVNAIKAAWHTVVALATGGAAVWVPVAAFLLLAFAVVVILLGMSTIVNDEQEISEITALVAELDEELTEEINEMGASPILYADASGTYGLKDGDGELLTIDADLRDGKSDLKEVTAKSVTVQTDAEAVAAYIDAKYNGEWQVGAASWKFTVDAFGKTWNVIQWDNMPEWARKALNSTDRLAFEVLLQEALKYYVDDTVGLNDLNISNKIAREIAQETSRLVYDEQLQGLGEDVIVEVVKKTMKKYRSELNVTDDEARQIYYHMNDIITEAIAEYEPVALVYDEVVELHGKLNFWSEDYEKFETSGSGGGASLGGSSGAAGTNNKYGYPNSRGYDAVELAKWDGYNEISVFGVSESGTTSTMGDGTRITNTWSDTNMAIACEGLQNHLFAYWTASYKAATGISSDTPVKVTLYNPETGATVTAEVRDCGGWRGFNPNYVGMNADRQWDVLPAVWKALGGGTMAGLMKVYWRVDPDATVGGGAWMPDPIVIDDYDWKDETDKGDGKIEIARPTYIAHSVHDLLNNGELLDEVMHKDEYPSKAVYNAAKSFVITKVQGVMQELLTMENIEGDAYVDYLYLRRNLGNPFGKDENGDPVQWIVTHRYNPGYENFEHDDAYVEAKPLSSVKKVRAVHKGTVEEVDDGTVKIRWEIDSATSAEFVYYDLKDVKVEEGDEVKRSTVLGTMSGGSLRVAYYEVNNAALQMESKKDWAYNPALFVQGFAGFQEPKEPEEYVGPSASRSLADCESIVDFAYSRLGCPYVWGATGPVTFDCSGLTQWCYARAGITIPRNSEAQHDAAAAAGNAHPVNEAEMQPGDILWKSGHVGIYIGNNQYIHAPQTGDVVKVSTGVHYFTHYLRFG